MVFWSFLRVLVLTLFLVSTLFLKLICVCDWLIGEEDWWNGIWMDWKGCMLLEMGFAEGTKGSISVLQVGNELEFRTEFVLEFCENFLGSLVNWKVTELGTEFILEDFCEKQAFGLWTNRWPNLCLVNRQGEFGQPTRWPSVFSNSRKF